MQKIGRYEIIEEIGHGAMGAVYRARDTEIGRVVALKVIHTSGASPEEVQRYKQRFKREAQAAGKLSHPAIVTIHDIAEDQAGHPYIVMEFVDGRPLNLLLGPNTRLPFELLIDIGIQVAQALDFAHRNGVIHRDIKPPNILVTPDGHAKIADFGIARMEGTELTQEGMSLGTPSYMSPEQFRGGAIDGRTDIFSLGAVLYWMFTGTKPFPGDTVTIASFQIAYENPALPSAAKTDLPKALDDILMRCLAKNPEHRYATCEDLAVDLEALKSGRSLPVRAFPMQEGTEAFPLPVRKNAPTPRKVAAEVPAEPRRRTPANAPVAAKGNSARGLNPLALLAAGGGIALVGVLAAVLWLRSRPAAEQNPPPSMAAAAAVPAAATTPATEPAPAAQPSADTAPAAATGTPSDNPPAQASDESQPAAEPTAKAVTARKRAKDASASSQTEPASPPVDAAAAGEALPDSDQQKAAPPAKQAPAKQAPKDAEPVVLSKIDVECRFPFKKGTLEITVDGNAFLQEKLEQKRNMFTAGITEKKGFEKKEIPIAAGERKFHVHIEASGGSPVWDGDMTGVISKTETARLRILAKEVSKDNSGKPQLEVLLEPSK